MDDAPDIASIAVLIGDPTRAKLLMALIGGRALTATELAGVTGVTKQTISAHLSRLLAAQLIVVQSQGRHRYFRLAGRDVARLLEHLMSVASRDDVGDVRTGPREWALRVARVCYDHLAGELAVRMFDGFEQQKFFRYAADGVQLSKRGAAYIDAFGIDIAALSQHRRALCRTCLDWSERRHHLAGALGAALLNRFFELDWARRAKSSRAVTFSALGLMEMRRQFGVLELESSRAGGTGPQPG
jgi:DNA-binding transcriptional ArsR family regulator